MNIRNFSVHKGLSPKDWGLLLVMVTATTVLAHFTVRTQWALLLGCFGVLFAAYALLSRSVNTSNWQSLTAWGLILRLIVLFAFPNLSDDLYRFVWDGRLLTQGINPFLELPTHYLEPGNTVPGLNKDLFTLLNSQEYYTIYPPISQAIFALGCWLFPTSLYGASLVMKVTLFLGELATLRLMPRLLQRLKMDPKHVVWYALNPLVIVELVGNLHFEALMICFLVASVYQLVQGKWGWASVLMALSIGVKLLPLMFFPFLIKRMGWAGSFRFFVLTGLLVLLQFAPFINAELIANFSDSVDLYFRKFEFNASVYFMIRWLSGFFVEWNIIAFSGPILAGGTLYYIIRKTVKEKQPGWSSLPTRMLLAQSVYYLLATIVHPWYLTTLVALSVFSRYRYAMVWSGLATLSYYTYRDTTYTENMGLVAVEYGGLLLFWLYENQSNAKKSPLIEPSAKSG